MATPPPWRFLSCRKRVKLGIEISESRMSGESQVSEMQMMEGEWTEQRSERSSSLGRRLRALKNRILVLEAE